jgi:two-component system response regulator ArlR
MKDRQKILIIEDEKALARLLELTLTHEGYETAAAYDGVTGFGCVSGFLPDLVLLDIMLPGMDGVEVCRRVRRFSQVPVIMLTAKDGISDKVSGLDCGANDYITKPFDMDELLARIRAALRTASCADSSELLAAGDLVMDLSRHTVTRSGQTVSLTRREFEMLRYLLKNRGIVLSRDRMLEEVWGPDCECAGNVVDVYIRYLRAKIDDRAQVKLIHTVRGFGYVLSLSQDGEKQ